MNETIQGRRSSSMKKAYRWRQRGGDRSGRGSWWELVVVGVGHRTGFGARVRIFLVGFILTVFGQWSVF